MITFTGRLLREKGLLPLTQAFSQLQKIYPDTYLCIAGDGDLEQELRAIDDSHMKILGRLDAGEIIDLLRITDIFCLPSVSEGFSTSLLEAAACGNYIVVTDTACPYELLPDHTGGTILRELSASAIADGLCHALEHPKERQTAIKNTYQKLTENFTWDIVTDKVQAL